MITKDQLTKTQRDQLILEYLKKFKICSRNQLCHLLFKNNANPINTCNTVMKRLVRDGFVCSFPRTKDQCYCYTLKGYNPKNQKNDHQLKIVDSFIHLGEPKECAIEPILGSYEPDLFYRDHFNRSVCVEVQLTKVSLKKMQEKVNQFTKEYGVNHDARLLVVFSDHVYSGIVCNREGFKVRVEPLPKESFFAYSAVNPNGTKPKEKTL